MANFARSLVSRLVAESGYEEDDFDSNLPQPGDAVEAEVGDRVKSVYGTHWVTATGTVNGLWTSERRQDVATGQGRGLRHNFVTSLYKADLDCWLKVKWSDDTGSLVVVDPV